MTDREGDRISLPTTAAAPGQATAIARPSHRGLEVDEARDISPPQLQSQRQKQQQQQQQQQQASRHPRFAPFFTLVDNTTNRSTHHPHVHYIFADDDPDILTQFLAENHPSTARSSASSSEHRPSELRGATTRTPRSRAIVLDVAPGTEGSWEVTGASSLSAEWAVVDARITRMDNDADNPAGDDATDEAAGERGLMLRVEGVEHEPNPVQPPAEADLLASESGIQIAGREDYPALIGEFERRMGVLRRVVAAGEETMRRRAAADNSTVADNATLPATQLAASARPKAAPGEEPYTGEQPYGGG